MSSQNIIPKNHRLWWQSSYDRGLDILLVLWPQIKQKFPDAELWITYGWDLFEAGYRDNPERLKWRDKVNELMKQKGIKHLGRLGKKQLRELRSQCGIWSYCTYFQEISCIGALESQSDGLIPVTMDNFALKETVGSGSKVEGDIYDQETKDKWLTELFKYMGDEKLWEQESKKAIKFASDYSWEKIAGEWTRYFV